jgi:Fe2+ transport system protein FeoA
MMNQTTGISLLALKKGSKARITSINHGDKTSRLMLSHGLRVGTVIDILQQRKRGVVIGSGATRIALGPDIARKLQVEQVS